MHCMHCTSFVTSLNINTTQMFVVCDDMCFKYHILVIELYPTKHDSKPLIVYDAFHRSMLDRFLLANVLDWSITWSGASSYPQFMLFSTWSGAASTLTPNAAVSRYSGFIMLCNIKWINEQIVIE